MQESKLNLPDASDASGISSTSPPPRCAGAVWHQLYGPSAGLVRRQPGGAEAGGGGGDFWATLGAAFEAVCLGSFLFLKNPTNMEQT